MSVNPSTVRALPSYGTIMRHLEAFLDANPMDTDDLEDTPHLVTLVENLDLWHAAGRPEELPWKKGIGNG